MAKRSTRPRPKVLELLQACQLSLDAALADVRMPRLAALTIFADGPQARETAISLENAIRSSVGDLALDVIHQWGPHRGSRHITLFCRTRKPETRDTLLNKLARLLHAFEQRAQKINWKKLLKGSKAALKVAVHAGKIGFLLTVAGARPDLQLFVLPPVAYYVLAVASEVADLTTEIGDLFATAAERERERQQQEQAQAASADTGTEATDQSSTTAQSPQAESSKRTPLLELNLGGRRYPI
jgi:hypothetical protein